MGEGDTVKQGQLLARIQPQEWKADVDFYADSERQSAAQVARGGGDLRYQEAQTEQPDAPGRGESGRGASPGGAGGQADLENARLNFEREDSMYRKGVEAAQAYDQARTTYDGRAGARRGAAQAGAGGRGGRRPGEGQRRPGRRAARRPRCQHAPAGGRRRAEGEGEGAPRLHRDPRADRRRRRRARGAARRGRGPGQGHRHADRPRRSLGAGRRRGELHRPRPPRRRDDRAPALGRRARRAPSSIAASTPTTRPSATSAAPSATSRPSRSACAATTPTAASPRHDGLRRPAAGDRPRAARRDAS